MSEMSTMTAQELSVLVTKLETQQKAAKEHLLVRCRQEGHNWNFEDGQRRIIKEGHWDHQESSKAVDEDADSVWIPGVHGMVRECKLCCAAELLAWPV